MSVAVLLSEDPGDREELLRLLRKLERARRLLEEVAEYLRGRSDVDREGTGPNEAMSLLTAVEGFLDD